MTTYLAVSTFNRSGMVCYGRRMVSSFLAHWPENVGLRLYSEGWWGPDLDMPTPASLGPNAPEQVIPTPQGGQAAVTIMDLAATVPWLGDFKARNAHRTFKDYRWDAVRFAHKAAAVCHAARHADADVVIWLDGDIVTHSAITIDDLDGLRPRGDEWISWLSRKNMYPECGFYMINRRHADHRNMIAAFEQMYTEGHLYGLNEYHDSYVLKHVVEMAGVSRRSLSGDAAGHSHPLINGPLGQWMDHLKGPRKRAGKSRATDLMTARKESYWT